MIRVAPAPEPPRFDDDVRKPGLDAIREMVGEPPLVTRRGPKRKKIAASRDGIPAAKFPPFWRDALDDMLGEYKRLCAFSCLYIEELTGAATVDHMLPKSTHWDHVYEWSNYRLSSGLMNSRKDDFADVIDPFDVQEGWFALELDDLQVVCFAGLDAPTVNRVEATIARLKLNDRECTSARREYVQSYRDGGRLDYLERRAPFIARELRRQNKLRPGDV